MRLGYPFRASTQAEFQLGRDLLIGSLEATITGSRQRIHICFKFQKSMALSISNAATWYEKCFPRVPGGRELDDQTNLNAGILQRRPSSRLPFVRSSSIKVEEINL
jgi:hypothetical protein